MHLEIINKSNNPNPQYQTDASAGMDLMAYLEKPIKISPGEFKLIGTGIFLKIPMGYEAQVRPCLLYTSPSPRDQRGSRMPSSA